VPDSVSHRKGLIFENLALMPISLMAAMPNGLCLKKALFKLIEHQIRNLYPYLWQGNGTEENDLKNEFDA
jgi:hypothetical protein